MFFSYTAKASIPFKRRQKTYINYIAATALIAFTVKFLITGNGIALLFFYSLFFIIYFIKSPSRTRYLITHLTISDEQVVLKYLDKEQEIELFDSREAFRFKLKSTFAISQYSTPFLAIYYKDKLIIKQFEGEWTEDMFREVIQACLPSHLKISAQTAS